MLTLCSYLRIYFNEYNSAYQDDYTNPKGKKKLDKRTTLNVAKMFNVKCPSLFSQIIFLFCEHKVMIQNVYRTNL